MSIDVEGRLRRAEPSDMVRGCMWHALVAVVRQEVGEAAVRQIEADAAAARDTMGEFPVAPFLRALGRAVDLVGAKRRPNDFMEAVGRAGVAAIAASPSTKKLAEKVAGRPARLLEYMQAAPRPLLVGYGSRTVVIEGETRARIQYRRGVLPAAVHAGMYAEMVLMAGATGAKARFEETDTFDQTFDIEWTLPGQR